MENSARKPSIYRMDREILVYLKYCKAKHPEVTLSDIVNDGVRLISESDVEWQQNKDTFIRIMDNENINGTL